MNTETESLDVIRCEHCEQDAAGETAVQHVDVLLCAACNAGWRKHFAACRHAWEQHVNEWGEDARYCRRCSAVVCVEDFPILGLVAP